MAVLTARSRRTLAYARLGDESLARRAAAGNDAAFTVLYERYHGPLLGYCRSILLDAEDARDATQSALENALRALPRREPGRPLKPWLYRIAHNEAINIVRRRAPQVQLDPETALTVPGPEDDAETRGRLSQLVRDLRELPERQRGALVMRELSGLSYDEIAAALGVTNEAARRAVFDARSALHAAVAGRATECVSVRHKLSDGDRRSLRARGIRAHLRSCDDCASFQRAIAVRRTDLHAIGWLPGATGLGLLASIGGAGGGALIVASGGSVAAGGGLGWATLPVAAKSLVVAAAVATSGGAAAVEIRHLTKDGTRTPQAQLAQPAAARRAAPALTSPHTIASSAASLKAATRSATRAGANTRPRSNASAHGKPAPTAAQRPARGNVPAITPATPAPAAALAQTTAAPEPLAHPTATKTPVQLAIDKLTDLRKRIRQAHQQAQATAASGTTHAIESASAALEQTLGALRPILERTLATVGLKLPASATASPPPPSSPTPTNILTPVQQVLSGVDTLLQSLFSAPPR